MTVLQLVLLILVIAIVGYVAYWIINKFFAEPVRTPALLVVGLLLLVALLVAFFPGVGGAKIW